MSLKTTGPVLTKPPAVMGRFSESRTGACVPPVVTPMACGAASGAGGAWPLRSAVRSNSDRKIKVRRYKRVTPLGLRQSIKDLDGSHRIQRGLSARHLRNLRLGVDRPVAIHDGKRRASEQFSDRTRRNAIALSCFVWLVDAVHGSFWVGSAVQTLFIRLRVQWYI